MDNKQSFLVLLASLRFHFHGTDENDKATLARPLHYELKVLHYLREPVWPSGKALGLVSGRTSVRYRVGSPFTSKRLWFADTVL